MTARHNLPNRRPHFASALEWAGVNWLLGVGIDEAGRAAEVFADLADAEAVVDGAIVTLVHEASITCSHLLQHGVSAAEHAARLDAHEPGLLCLMLRRAAELEAEHGAAIASLYAWAAERRAEAAAREFAGAAE